MNRAKFHFDNIYSNALKKFGPFLLFQIGDLNCNSGYYVSPHTQKVYEISYIVSGKGTFTVSGKNTPVEKDMVFINTVGDVHSIQSSEDDPLRFFYLGFTFDEEAVRQNKYQDLEEFFRNPKSRELHNSAGIRDLYIKLFNELISNNKLTDLMITTYLMQIIITTIRSFNEQKLRRYLPQRIFHSKDQFVYDVVNYIDTKAVDIKGLETLSSEFGYSYSYIEHQFSDIMGESLKNYYRRKKFEKATEMLKLNDNVTQVSNELGYKSIHSFSRAFHKYFGYSPSEYLKKQSLAERMREIDRTAV